MPAAATRPLLVFGPWSPRYDLGPTHPLTPRRFAPGIELLTAMTGEPPALLAPEPATDEVLAWVHDPAYIRTVRRRSEAPFGPNEAGVGPGDTPAFAGMHEAAAAVAGGSVRAIEAILTGESAHVFHPGGGLHHAMPDRAAGFCIYNDPALAIARARREGLRVLYVDLDVHHGDGVQEIHRHDPGVLSVSIHQSGATLFPGSGFIDELGAGEASGTVVNLPMDPGTGEQGWLGALQRVLPEVAAAFGPDLVVSQHGADAHAWDPLANLRVTTTAMGAAARLIDSIAHRWAGGRWLATGGGGYDAYRVVPRAWALVWLAALHRNASGPIPPAWRARWAVDAEHHGQAPLPEWLEDLANAGVPVDSTQEQADRRAGQTADQVRELVVPVLVRAAGDLRWWRAIDDLTREQGTPDSNRHPDDTPAELTRSLEPAKIVGSVDADSWSALTLAPRTLPPADATMGHVLVLAALRSDDAVRVTAAVAGRQIVGAVVSAAPASADRRMRLLLAVGVAPRYRRAGLAGAMIREHLAGVGDGTTWEAAVTLAERDPFEPLARATRMAIAWRLLESAGLQVQRADGPAGAADPDALVMRRV